MTDLTSYQSKQPIKLLLIGNSGVGKTGALAALAKAGYNLRILDYDNGLDPLALYLRAFPEALARVKYKSLQDKMKTLGGKIFPDGQPTAFSNGLALLDHWKTVEGDKVEDLGKPSAWDSKTVLIIDSLTFMSAAALRRVLSLNGRSGTNPQIQDWGEAMAQIEDLLSLLYSDFFKCHVIVTSHITYIGNDEAGTGAIGYPSTLGNKLPPKVGRWFNTMLYMDKRGTGADVKRTIYTQPYRNIDVKCPIPGIASELPIESGLATLFEKHSQA